MEKNLEINIAHLFPKILNNTGDFGNILTFKNRLEWRNINANIDNISSINDLDFNKYDIYYIGGGMQDKEISLIANELSNYANEFKKLVDNGTVFLAVSAGFQLFCKHYQDKNRNKINCLGIFNAYSVAENSRLTGNMTVETDFLNPKTLVGFENHNSYTYLSNDTKPLGKVIVGNGDNPADKTEGARLNNAFGTYLQGPILPKNPAFCDYLLELAIQKKLNNLDYKLSMLDDELENLTHKQLIKKAY